MMSKTKVKTSAECPHNYISCDEGEEYCEWCGNTREYLIYDPEWKSYNDDVHTTDTSRCHAPSSKRDSAVKTKLELLVQNPLPVIVEKTTQFYDGIIKKCYKDTNIRGKTLKGLIGICLMYAYREYGCIQTNVDICTLMKIKMQKFTQYQKQFFKTYPKYTVNIIYPSDIVEGIAQKIGVCVPQDIYRIKKLSLWLQDSTNIVNNYAAITIANAIVYLYISTPEYYSDKPMPIKEYARLLNTSEITINKICNVIKKYIAEANGK